MFYILGIYSLIEGYYKSFEDIISFRNKDICMEICNILNSYKLDNLTKNTLNNIFENKSDIINKLTKLISKDKADLLLNILFKERYIVFGSYEELDNDKLFDILEIHII